MAFLFKRCLYPIRSVNSRMNGRRTATLVTSLSSTSSHEDGGPCSNDMPLSGIVVEDTVLWWIGFTVCY